MRIRIDARLRSEAARLSFRFACEDCVHFAPSAAGDGGRCSLGHPPEPRRAAMNVVEGGDEGYLETCKDFDLV
jgi:hypothetical protein